MSSPTSQARRLCVPERPRTEGQFAVIQVNTPNLTSTADATKPRRKRASKPKVRTGCTTCKIRRVKCDEEKPSCQRCTSTGRKCDGYAFTKDDPSTSEALTLPGSSSQAIQPPLFLPSSISAAFPGTAKERRIFHRFRVHTIPAFAGSSEVEFWQSLVLKVGLQEPVVRNAIVALGTLHEDYQTRQGKYSTDLVKEPSYQEALSLYGKALRQLNERLSEGNTTIAKLALISSILFACFEVLRRESMAAIIHFQAGMKELARQIRSSRGDEATSSPSSRAVTPFRPIPQDELDALLRVFARYDVQACTFAKTRAEALAINLPAHPPKFMTLSQVRMHLDNLLISVYQFIKSDVGMFRYWKADAISTEWFRYRDESTARFEAWLCAIEAFFQDPNLVLSLAEMKTLLGLRMQVKVALIMLKTCINSGPETSFDIFVPEFDEIVTRIEELADSLALREALPLDNESTAFTMELGILHPLFFVATKCRNWTIRRRAVTALKRGGREGVWEGPIMALVAERMIEIEEADVLPGDVIPEANRIHDVKKQVVYDSRQVYVELKRSIDQVDWKRWELIRETIRF